jgi:hypothetical protein
MTLNGFEIGRGGLAIVGMRQLRRGSFLRIRDFFLIMRDILKICFCKDFDSS